MLAPSTVDVDARATWPDALNALVENWATQYGKTTSYTNDLSVPLEQEEWVRDALSECWLRAFHCTRLLPHEVEMILRQGLRALSAGLLADRIAAARESGTISDDEARVIQNSHVFAGGEERNRDAQVCLTLSRQELLRDSHSVLPLLSHWGGEAVYKSSAAALLAPKLKTMGSPAIVQLRISINREAAESNFYPSLHKVFIGSALGLSNYDADVFYRASIPSAQIDAVISSSESEDRELAALLAGVE